MHDQLADQGFADLGDLTLLIDSQGPETAAIVGIMKGPVVIDPGYGPDNFTRIGIFGYFL